MMKKLMKAMSIPLLVLSGQVFAAVKGQWITYREDSGREIPASAAGEENEAGKGLQGKSLMDSYYRENAAPLANPKNLKQIFEDLKQSVVSLNTDQFQASLNDDGSISLYSPFTSGGSYPAVRWFLVGSDLNALCHRYGFGRYLEGSLKSISVRGHNGFRMEVNFLHENGYLETQRQNDFTFVSRIDCSHSLKPLVSHRYKEVEEKSGHTIIKRPEFRIHEQNYYYSAGGDTPAAVCRLYGFRELHGFEEYPARLWNPGGIFYSWFRYTVHLYPEAQFKKISTGNGIKWVECS